MDIGRLARRAGQHPPLSCPTSPPQGGRLTVRLLSPTSNVAGKARSETLVISPLAGEMAGRPEGGVQAQPEPHQGALLVSI
ncbi:hypothetical protein FJ543_19260 [Mesorhizobium sp. B2-5-7]|nr:hypothetical protein FJ543_19260 [Mesorhizobium sp. B2-5-7]